MSGSIFVDDVASSLLTQEHMQAVDDRLYSVPSTSNVDERENTNEQRTSSDDSQEVQSAGSDLVVSVQDVHRTYISLEIPFTQISLK